MTDLTVRQILDAMKRGMEEIGANRAWRDRQDRPLNWRDSADAEE
jgi:hypothetical protein